MGDFNDRCSGTWDSDHTGSELGTRYDDSIKGNNLFQIINEPTHIKQQSATILDVIITDSPGYMINSGVWAPIGDPYHCSIFCTFETQMAIREKHKRHIWQYDKCDFELLNQHLLRAPWHQMYLYNNTHDAAKYFRELFLQKYVPFSTELPDLCSP